MTISSPSLFSLDDVPYPGRCPLTCPLDSMVIGPRLCSIFKSMILPPPITLSEWDSETTYTGRIITLTLLFWFFSKTRTVLGMWLIVCSLSSDGDLFSVPLHPAPPRWRPWALISYNDFRLSYCPCGIFWEAVWSGVCFEFHYRKMVNSLNFNSLCNFCSFWFRSGWQLI